MRDGNGNFNSIDYENAETFITDEFNLAFEAATPVSVSGAFTVDFTLPDSYCESEFYTAQQAWKEGIAELDENLTKLNWIETEYNVIDVNRKGVTTTLTNFGPDPQQLLRFLDSDDSNCKHGSIF